MSAGAENEWTPEKCAPPDPHCEFGDVHRVAADSVGTSSKQSVGDETHVEGAVGCVDVVLDVAPHEADDACAQHDDPEAVEAAWPVVPPAIPRPAPREEDRHCALSARGSGGPESECTGARQTFGHPRCLAP